MNVGPNGPGNVFFQSGGYPVAPAVGTKSPLRNNTIMFNGPTNLTSTNTGATGNGYIKTPGTLTEFRVARVVTTDAATGITTTNDYLHRFTYQINYDAILDWLKNTGPNPFPPRMRAGGILYYDSIPDTIPTNVHPIPTTGQLSRDQRFWKEFIDECLGFQQYGTSTTSGVTYARYSDYSGKMGYGSYFNWPSRTTAIYASGRGMEGLTMPVSGPTNSWQERYDPASPTFDSRFMDYRDNPCRPRTQFWFGPMNMVDFLGNIYMNASTTNRPRNWLPGTSHESPMWQAKRGVVSAINDIKQNHPNDMVSLIAFSLPTGYTPSMASLLSGTYNAVRSPLGRDYKKMVNSLYFPSVVASTNTEIHPYDPGMDDLPRAIGGTNPAYGLMLAYNQFSRGATAAQLQTFATAPAPLGTAGGFGRPGAQKLIVLQTDGVPTSTVYAPGGMDALFADQGGHKSYFKIRYDKSGSAVNEYPPYLISGPDASTQALEVAQRLCNSETGAASGYSSPRKPVRIHTLAFGSLFEAGGANADTAKAFLQQVQYIGGVQTSAGEPLAAEKVITGTSQQRIDKMQTAFSKIMQDGYSVTLID